MKKIYLITGSVLLLAGGIYAWRTSLCGSSGQSPTQCFSNKMSVVCEMSCAAKGVSISEAKKQSEAKAGDITQCPVSGVVFLINPESSKVAYQGKSATTCCGTCAQMFHENPGQYAGNIN